MGVISLRLASMAHLKIQFFHFSLAGVRQRGDTIVS
jgi:hypothetical protein